MLVFDGKGQGRCAVLVFRTPVRALGEQQLDHFDMPVGGSLVQRCPAVAAGQVDIGTTGDQLSGGRVRKAGGGRKKNATRTTASLRRFARP